MSGTWLESCVRFLQRLIQTPSLPGQEKEIALLVAREMEGLGYDQVWRDEAGNVIGVWKGEGTAPALMLNTHLDHVDVGEAERWPYPPFAVKREGGRIWGRGAMDIKGPLASQVYGAGLLVREKQRPPGDVYVTAVVQEEVGGLGARFLAQNLQAPLVVIGEASRNQLRRGHRGRTELVLHVTGKSVHASVPERGVNPLQVVARFLLALEKMEPPADPDLGPCSVAPTLIRTDQSSPNVVPGQVWLTLDWRNIPGQSAEGIRRLVAEIAEASLVPGAACEVEVPVVERTSYTGLRLPVPSHSPAYLLPAQHPALTTAWRVLRESIGLEESPSCWQFATDGGHFAAAGMTVIGFGPGEEELAHTVRESIPVSHLETAVHAYRDLALKWPLALERDLV